MSARHCQNKKSQSKKITKELIVKAQSKNSFDELIAFHSFARNGLDSKLICKRVSELEPTIVQWAFDLLKRNMHSMYLESCWGWNEDEKRKEMTSDKSWYLVALNTDGNPIAFSHFQYDLDYGFSVLYCYELQLELECRRKGMGKFMLQVLELMAFRAGLDKVILTVFLHNPAARNFFKSVGYTLDETSPVSTIEEQFDYEILSKYKPTK
nr:EOG090X0MNC [Sida crystallina]